jgi:hypothetical protein
MLNEFGCIDQGSFKEGFDNKEVESVFDIIENKEPLVVSEQE